MNHIIKWVILIPVMLFLYQVGMCSNNFDNSRNYILSYQASYSVGSDLFNPMLANSLLNSINKEVQYFDDLGRKTQRTVLKANYILSSDLTDYIEYDGFGREKRVYLPYAYPSQSGSYQLNFDSDQNSFYDEYAGISQGNYAFTENIYGKGLEPRNMQQIGPGAEWRLGVNKVSESEQRLNTLNEVYKLWVDNNGNIVAGSYYPANTLKVYIERDENQGLNRSELKVYKDFMSNEILYIRKNGNTNDYTYFIYDTRNKLRFVLQPEGFAQLKAYWPLLNDSNFRKKWMFEFKYDARNRLIIKGVPGADDIHYVYDKYDRLVLMQDAKQRFNNEWTFFQYDMFDRELMSGTKVINMNRSALQTQIDASNQSYPPIINEVKMPYSLYGYSHSTYQANSTGIDLVNYYDTYDFNSDGNNDYNYISNPDWAAYNVNLKNSPSSLNTGKFAKDLNNQGKWRKEVHYYNEMDRLIQTQTYYKLDTTPYVDVSHIRYNLQGQIKDEYLIHKYNTMGEILMHRTFTYDQGGRLITVKCKVNSDPEVIMEENEYDDLGKLVKKRIHSANNGTTFLQDVDYKYNIRSWLTDINKISYSTESDPTNPNEDIGIQQRNIASNDDIFAMHFGYTANNKDQLNSPSQFNGQINQIRWQSKLDVSPHSYGFSYDTKGQLTQAIYAAFDWSKNNWTKDENKFNVNNLAYDANGNVKTLMRNSGSKGSSKHFLVDDLSYGYEGNQLIRLNDDANKNMINDFEDFGLNGNSNIEFVYDENGNLINDLAKNITYQYNKLNLPSHIDFNSTATMDFVYGADGELWKRKYSVLNDEEYTIEYINGFYYKDSEFEYINLNDSRIVYANGAQEFRYEYFYKDHQGNIRLSYSDLNNNSVIETNEILQDIHYYPFGMENLLLKERQSGIENPLKYSGEEQIIEGIDADNNGKLDSYINVYNYDLRQYDASLIRWNTIDPNAEKRFSFSPYNFVQNNPINRVDPTGGIDDWVERANADGLKTIVWDPKVTSKNDVDLGKGDVYLGKNVLVATHNRDSKGNEPINSAKFDLYLESDKSGPSATIYGNTIPSNIEIYGTLKEGLYSARSQGRSRYISNGKEDLALIINEGMKVPTTSNSPKSSISEVFFHMGNNYQTSLYDSRGNAYSRGCQTSGCFEGSRNFHNDFMKKISNDFNGNYYLRGN